MDDKQGPIYESTIIVIICVRIYEKPIYDNFKNTYPYFLFFLMSQSVILS